MIPLFKEKRKIGTRENEVNFIFSQLLIRKKDMHIFQPSFKTTKTQFF